MHTHTHTHTHPQASGVTIYITPLAIKAARLEITSALYTSLTTNSRTSKWEETAPTWIERCTGHINNWSTPRIDREIWEQKAQEIKFKFEDGTRRLIYRCQPFTKPLSLKPCRGLLHYEQRSASNRARSNANYCKCDVALEWATNRICIPVFTA